jgi:rhamnopyranosyl-N-acetylglucosaminyl-diphospho-decaprenol beta-1,3/1,4-galactofuranosyltransferase
MIPDSVVAVVVTYNRLQLLQECIEGLRSQTRPLTSILVINNSSTDGSEEWLLSQPDIQTVTQPNLGGAAGFYMGIKTGFESGYEWLWCMDDDGRPDKHALETLMQHTSRKPCVINSLVLNKAKPEEILFSPQKLDLISQIRTKTLEDVGTFFNATLFHRDVIEKVGMPLKELVIWGDEMEYLFRITRKYRFPLFSVTDSFHYHPAQNTKFYKNEWTMQQGWRVYFFIRNKRFVFDSKYRSAFRSIFTYLLFLCVFFSYIMIYQKKEKGRKFKLFFKAAKDGFKRRTGIAIKDIQDYINTI